MYNKPTFTQTNTKTYWYDYEHLVPSTSDLKHIKHYYLFVN